MKLIQDWSNQDKAKLLNRILEVLGDKEYVDIVVYGSRVTGDFTVKSDIDVGIYVNEIKRCPCCHLQPTEIINYVNGIYHPENELGNWFLMDITFDCSPSTAHAVHLINTMLNLKLEQRIEKNEKPMRPM